MGKFEDNVFEVLTLGFSDASRDVLNGRSAEVDLCLKPLSQKDVIVTRSPLKKLMSPSLKRSGRLIW